MCYKYYISQADACAFPLCYKVWGYFIKQEIFVGLFSKLGIIEDKMLEFQIFFFNWANNRNFGQRNRQCNF